MMLSKHSMKKISLFLLVGVMFCILGYGYYRIRRPTMMQNSALKALEINIKKLMPHAEAMGMSCDNKDEDNDGYVFCDASFQEKNGTSKIETFECGYSMTGLIPVSCRSSSRVKMK